MHPARRATPPARAPAAGELTPRDEHMERLSCANSIREFAQGARCDKTWRGGEGGIRTPDTVARMPHFECGAFDHSATSPEVGTRRARVVGVANNMAPPPVQAPLPGETVRREQAR